jgi:hypothetical protein
MIVILLEYKECVGAFPIAVEGLLALFDGAAVTVNEHEICVVHVSLMYVPLLEVLIVLLIVLLIAQLLLLLFLFF